MTQQRPLARFFGQTLMLHQPCGEKSVQSGKAGVGIRKMAGERAQVSVIVNQAADAGNFAVAERVSAKRSFARQQAGDNILALLRLERTGAIDECAALFGQRGRTRK